VEVHTSCHFVGWLGWFARFLHHVGLLKVRLSTWVTYEPALWDEPEYDFKEVIG